MSSDLKKFNPPEYKLQNYCYYMYNLSIFTIYIKGDIKKVIYKDE